MTKTLITDIAKAIQEGESDSEVKTLILKYKEDFKVNVAPDDWMIQNYALLRRWAYPDIEDFLDATVKINSGDPALAAEGQAQLDDYVAKCLAVKAKYPEKKLISKG
jgi:hypothetical protein